ncbi:hypothetical protein [Tropicimonas aquimaris]|uniref:DUF2282 domain-containing protein n=1 Tax=Tropicimonas aquimaris TaxID=914152 RepID=A0ABW3IRN6_9RHOB
MKTLTQLLGMLALGGVMLATTAWMASAQGQPPGGGNGAPPEAIEACVGKAVGDACSMTNPRDNRSAEGSCISTPEKQLACLPAGAPAPGN